jgi:hypothetical protein
MSVTAATTESQAPSSLIRWTTPAASLAALGIVYGDLREATHFLVMARLYSAASDNAVIWPSWTLLSPVS